MKWKIYILLLVVLSIGFASCEQFLDTLPDNRTQIDTEKKINQLLVSAYPGANYAVLAELSSDNFVDNNAILPVQLSAYERMHDEIFAWEPVTSSTRQDSPSFVWESCYAAIATANQALEAIAELTEQDASLDLSAQKGEALLCRAYSHFILVNIFAQAYKDEERSQVDPGVPYVTQSETVVSADYKRESVQEVYAKIEEDLEAGLALISDHHYTVPKYHFNTKAANAFAARFYLYKRDYQKVVKYADKVLGTNPTNLMRRWDVDYDNIDAIIYDYVSVNQAANFLLLPTSSLFGRIYGKRYGHNYDAMFGSTYGSGPTWSTVLPAFDGKLYISVQQDYGVFFPKASEMFEYTDKVAGIGFTHIVRAEFTAEETLLCRAEALIYLDRINEAVADLQVWNSSHLAPEELTLDVINNFYRPHNILFVKGLRNAKMSNQFKITPEQLPLIHCVLHFRRIETMFDGYRWFDIKRYGIEITHNIDGKGLQQLSFDDERRAIQLPQEVISAGMESNPRTMDAQSSEMYEKFKN
ncbi:MAG: RagB/SusD family nutrient uptake outer membrane protein [Bacteroidales bacterium]|nr:RagB/SusD family nutrient uptake outer membrane protein [Bacteroidales bacterium]